MHFFWVEKRDRKREKGEREKGCKVSRSVRWATKREVTNVVKVVLQLFIFQATILRWRNEERRKRKKEKLTGPEDEAGQIGEAPPATG